MAPSVFDGINIILPVRVTGVPVSFQPAEGLYDNVLPVDVCCSSILTPLHCAEEPSEVSPRKIVLLVYTCGKWERVHRSPPVLVDEVLFMFAAHNIAVAGSDGD